MAKEQTNLKDVSKETPANPATKTERKKLSVRQMKLSEMEVGFTFGGKFCGIVAGAPYQHVDQKTGELITKQIPSAVFEKDGERIAYLADRGLQQSLETAQVQAGQVIEIVKLEKQQLSKGRTMNAYDIFAV